MTGTAYWFALDEEGPFADPLRISRSTREMGPSGAAGGEPLSRRARSAHAVPKGLSRRTNRDSSAALLISS